MGKNRLARSRDEYFGFFSGHAAVAAMPVCGSTVMVTIPSGASNGLALDIAITDGAPFM